MSTDWNGTEFAAGCATYGGLTDEVRSLKAEVRWQTQRGDRWHNRHDDVVAQLHTLWLTVHRVRSLPRYTIAAGDRVVSAADLDKSLAEVAVTAGRRVTR